MSYRVWMVLVLIGLIIGTAAMRSRSSRQEEPNSSALESPKISIGEFDPDWVVVAGLSPSMTAEEMSQVYGGKTDLLKSELETTYVFNKETRATFSDGIMKRIVGPSIKIHGRTISKLDSIEIFDRILGPPQWRGESLVFYKGKKGALAVSLTARDSSRIDSFLLYVDR